MEQQIHLPPLTYAHVLNVNTTLTLLVCGPKTFVLATNEKLVVGPKPFISVPKGFYTVVKHPIQDTTWTANGHKLRFNELEVRFSQEPFPLFPGEELLPHGVEGDDNWVDENETPDSNTEPFTPDFAASKERKLVTGVLPLPIIPAGCALRIRARADFMDGKKQRRAGDLFQVDGPGSYQPRPECVVTHLVRPTVIGQNQALRLIAIQATVDGTGHARVANEEWLVTHAGSYLPRAYERVVALLDSYVLGNTNALHMRALISFEDRFGVQRRVGSEWLVTNEHCSTYIPGVEEEIVTVVDKTVLGAHEYCVIRNPVDAELRPQYGRRKLMTGITSFFLHPNEELENGIEAAYILSPDEALVLTANESFKDGKKKRLAGDRWLLTGPLQYIPPIEVRVVEHRKSIALSNDEGIYIRNMRTGAVQAVLGPRTVMLNENEELWEKELPPLTEKLLLNGGGFSDDPEVRKLAYFEAFIDPDLVRGVPRDKTRVVRYRCPNNTAVQIYDFKTKKSRFVFGPELVQLGPDEDFHVLSLSAGKPKRENAMQSLVLMLGPDYITDIVDIETSDHARLRLTLGYNNCFDVDKSSRESVQKIFAIGDWIGIACHMISSAIRSKVASIPFDTFHKNSTTIIREAIFGHGHGPLRFEVNNLLITSVDVQAIEPTDQHMRDSLSNSVRLAIEISTSSVEASAKHEANRMEQVARGQLERQKLANKVEEEKARLMLCELQALSAAVENVGHSKAEAQARADAAVIESRAQVELAQLRAQAEDLSFQSQLQILEAQRAAELEYLRETTEIELEMKRLRADLETHRFQELVACLKPATLRAIAIAGPEMQVRLLQSLGIRSTLLTDGHSPINLFQTAQGLLGAP